MAASSHTLSVSIESKESKPLSLKDFYTEWKPYFNSLPYPNIYADLPQNVIQYIACVHLESILAGCHDTISSENLKKLTDFFAWYWQMIKGTDLAYFINQKGFHWLLGLLASELSAHLGKSEFEILMPDLNVEEKIYDGTTVKDYLMNLKTRIKHFILTDEDEKHPARVLELCALTQTPDEDIEYKKTTRYAADGKELYDKTGLTLSSEELKRVSDHSPEAKAFFDARKKRIEAKQNAQTIRAFLERLVIKLRGGSYDAKQDGQKTKPTHERAGDYAYQGIDEFRKLMRCLSEEQRQKIYNLKGKPPETITFKDVWFRLIYFHIDPISDEKKESAEEFLESKREWQAASDYLPEDKKNNSYCVWLASSDIKFIIANNVAELEQPIQDNNQLCQALSISFWDAEVDHRRELFTRALDHPAYEVKTSYGKAGETRLLRNQVEVCCWYFKNIILPSRMDGNHKLMYLYLELFNRDLPRILNLGKKILSPKELEGLSFQLNSIAMEWWMELNISLSYFQYIYLNQNILENFRATLMTAIQYERTDIIAWLVIKKENDISQIQISGKPAASVLLDLAARCGHFTLFDYCLRVVNVTDEKPSPIDTALHSAAMTMREELVNHLIQEKKADVHSVDVQGKTILQKLAMVHDYDSPRDVLARLKWWLKKQLLLTPTWENVVTAIGETEINCLFTQFATKGHTISNPTLEWESVSLGNDFLYPVAHSSSAQQLREFCDAHPDLFFRTDHPEFIKYIANFSRTYPDVDFEKLKIVLGRLDPKTTWQSLFPLLKDILIDYLPSKILSYMPEKFRQEALLSHLELSIVSTAIVLSSDRVTPLQQLRDYLNLITTDEKKIDTAMRARLVGLSLEFLITKNEYDHPSIKESNAAMIAFMEENQLYADLSVHLYCPKAWVPEKFNRAIFKSGIMTWLVFSCHYWSSFCENSTSDFISHLPDFLKKKDRLPYIKRLTQAVLAQGAEIPNKEDYAFALMNFLQKHPPKFFDVKLEIPMRIFPEDRERSRRQTTFWHSRSNMEIALDLLENMSFTLQTSDHPQKEKLKTQFFKMIAGYAAKLLEASPSAESKNAASRSAEPRSVRADNLESRAAVRPRSAGPGPGSAS